MALPIRHQQGDTAANQLALLYLCMGRNEFWKRNFNEAEKLYRMAETLFARTLGADKHFMAQYVTFGSSSTNTDRSQTVYIMHMEILRTDVTIILQPAVLTTSVCELLSSILLSILSPLPLTTVLDA